MVAKCKCGKTKSFRGQRRHFTCPDCRAAREAERVATAVEIHCDVCGKTQKVTAKQIKKCEPCEGYLCGQYGCKVNHERPEPPLSKLIGWHLYMGWQLDGGFYSYSFREDTIEDMAAYTRACDIRDEGLRLLGRRP